ncbi:glutamine amidotransferase [Flexibacter flexilis DSM 6793]|uniref:Imidazole glycerol phosphate synthase subunit HisH n=1 Tax=Flexibacter flexilis DSM 6793 TaxID=927664 RepID=A0A1I1MK78_9BACT|nr:imidazole glycerol phosphate synthase subunit HisH [Flexibacter flexilis]SFC83043.1 glutamine amidotransferase [Flexibacter flexilis DSM 6793]
MKVAIVEYNAGNVQSVKYALERLGVEPVLTSDVTELRSADKVIFPGVGEASSAMRFLKNKNLDKIIPTLTQPVLGICLGLQLLCRHSQEGDADCLGVFDVEVCRFPQATEKVPHVGWNTLQLTDNVLLKDLPPLPHVYYVHSYYAQLSPYTIATTDYIVPFSAMLHRDNFYAAQFHPEKSSEVGEKIIANFLNL